MGVFDLFSMIGQVSLFKYLVIFSRLFFDISLLIAGIFAIINKPIFSQLSIEKYNYNRKINVIFWLIWALCWLCLYSYKYISLYRYFNYNEALIVRDYVVLIVIFGMLIVSVLIVMYIKKKKIYN